VGLKRLLLFVAFAAAMSLGLASSAPAGNFDEQKMGCVGENPATCATGTEGQAYSITIYLSPADGGRGEDFGCATFHHTSGNFPPGLTISDEGYISGTPTQAGEYDFYLTVRYQKNPGCFKNPSDDRFIIKINPGLAKLTIGPESTAPGTTGAPYSLQMTASVPDAKTWTINSGTLPPGLAMDGSTGLISGTPTAAGQFDFQVMAKMNGDVRSDTKSLAIVVRDPVTIAGSEPFTEARRAIGEVTAPFEAMLLASGGTGTYTWSLTSGALPTGLTLADGAIAGTPTLAGAYPFIVTVTDSEGRVANYPGRIVVAETLEVSTLLLRPGKVGKLYGARVRTIGGAKPAAWRILRGPLPRGVRFDRVTGTLFGIPKRPGNYRVTFEATDALGVTATKRLRIVIAAAPKPKLKKPSPRSG
jgi:large repetitive protein